MKAPIHLYYPTYLIGFIGQYHSEDFHPPPSTRSRTISSFPLGSRLSFQSHWWSDRYNAESHTHNNCPSPSPFPSPPRTLYPSVDSCFNNRWLLSHHPLFTLLYFLWVHWTLFLLPSPAHCGIFWLISARIANCCLDNKWGFARHGTEHLIETQTMILNKQYLACFR